MDPKDTFPGINPDSFSYNHFLKSGFISLSDEDSEQNFIPVINIDYIELDRKFIFPDNLWNKMRTAQKHR